MENFKFEHARKGELKPGDVVVSAHGLTIDWTYTGLCWYTLHTVTSVTPKQTVVKTDTGAQFSCRGYDKTYSGDHENLYILGDVTPEQIAEYDHTVRQIKEIYSKVKGVSLRKLSEAPAADIHDAHDALTAILERFGKEEK